MPLLSVESLETKYVARDGIMRAVDDVSLDIAAGETVALVGESGCGKSTLGKTLLRLVPSTAGRITFDGSDITNLSRRQLRPFRPRMQMIFQDAASALNPRHTVIQLLEGPLIVQGAGKAERRSRIIEVLEQVGLSEKALSSYPHEFSGGQKQRIVIARALILKPELIICDEPVSALDLSVQAQILNLLVELKRKYQLSYLFVSHDLGVVHYIADRILVMYRGRIVESADRQSFWVKPRHPYTRALLEAVPGQKKKTQTHRLDEQLGAADLAQGCRFQNRCPLATDLCRKIEPQLRALSSDHEVACHNVA